MRLSRTFELTRLLLQRAKEARGAFSIELKDFNQLMVPDKYLVGHLNGELEAYA